MEEILVPPRLRREPSSNIIRRVSDADDNPLSDLREKIDDLDRRLVALINERAGVVAEIGEAKRRSGAPIYTPHRETEVLKKVLSLNEGPLPDRALEGVYRELMSGSFAIEQPIHVGYLGPPGSFSHVAATAHFGSSVTLDSLADIRSVFNEVRRGHLDYGLVPIENSTGGGIVDTLDAFFDARDEVSIYAEVLVTVRHHLITNCRPEDIVEIYSKPEVFSQCRSWLSAHYPNATLIPMPSSSDAVTVAKQRISKDATCGVAAIGSEAAGRLYDMPVIFRDIEDNPNNITRFFILSREAAQRSGDDKTSVMFITGDEPGALVHVLSEFERAGINLTHIDKRPSGRKNWTYTFFIDAEGHRDSAEVAIALEDSKAHCKDFAVLGSYPRATRIL